MRVILGLYWVIRLLAFFVACLVTLYKGTYTLCTPDAPAASLVIRGAKFRTTRNARLLPRFDMQTLSVWVSGISSRSGVVSV